LSKTLQLLRSTLLSVELLAMLVETEMLGPTMQAATQVRMLDQLQEATRQWLIAHLMLLSL
jgi:hypothetical protein